MGTVTIVAIENDGPERDAILNSIATSFGSCRPGGKLWEFQLSLQLLPSK